MSPALRPKREPMHGTGTVRRRRVAFDRPTAIVLVVAFLVAGLAMSTPVSAPTTPDGEGEFTIVVLPDTQHYTESSTGHVIFGQQTQWIVDSQADLNTQFVTHLGDIVEQYASTTEWQRADAHMAILDTAGVRSGVAPGNHDLSTGTGKATNYDTYFPPSRYSANDWYGNYLGGGQPHVITGDPERLNKDNFETFSIAGMDFIIIHIEYGWPTYAVAWAGRVLDAYPNHRAILSTLAFLDGSADRPTSYNVSRVDSMSPADVWTNLIAPRTAMCSWSSMATTTAVTPTAVARHAGQTTTVADGLSISF